MLKHITLALLVAVGISAHANHGASHGNPKLEAEMKAIAATYGKLGQQIDDKTKNASSEKMVATLITQTETAAKQTPPGANGPEKVKVMEKYKNDMNTMMIHLKDMQAALKSGDNTKARTHFDALKQWTDPGHEHQYQ